MSGQSVQTYKNFDDIKKFAKYNFRALSGGSDKQNIYADKMNYYGQKITQYGINPQILNQFLSQNGGVLNNIPQDKHENAIKIFAGLDQSNFNEISEKISALIGGSVQNANLQNGGLDASFGKLPQIINDLHISL